MRPGLRYAVTVLSVLGLAVTACSGDDTETSTDTTAPRGAVDASGQELVSLLRAAQSLTYHATYERVSDDPEAPGAEVTIEVWRDGDRRREDTLTTAGGKTSRVAVIDDGHSTVTCTQPPDGEWSCTDAAATGDDQSLGTIADQAEAALTGETVGESDDTINSRDVRCFLAPSAGEPLEICVTDDGILARLRSTDATLELVELEHEADSNVFRPPA